MLEVWRSRFILLLEGEMKGRFVKCTPQECAEIHSRPRRPTEWEYELFHVASYYENKPVRPPEWIGYLSAGPGMCPVGKYPVVRNIRFTGGRNLLPGTKTYYKSSPKDSYLPAS